MTTGLTCKYISSGYYGCAVPLSDSKYSFRAGSYGYYVYNGNFDSDKTSNDDDQQIETAVLSKNPLQLLQMEKMLVKIVVQVLIAFMAIGPGVTLKKAILPRL